MHPACPGDRHLLAIAGLGPSLGFPFLDSRTQHAKHSRSLTRTPNPLSLEFRDSLTKLETTAGRN